MTVISTMQDKAEFESQMPYSERGMNMTMHEFISGTAEKFPKENAVSFQMFSDPDSPALTYNWTELLERVRQAANCFRDLGVTEKTSVAFLLPNAMETVVTLVGGAIAGIISPINPLLDSKQIASLLREGNAKVLVTIKPFPKTDIAQKAAEAVNLAPNVETVLEIDLAGYLDGDAAKAAAAQAPKLDVERKAKVLDFNAELDSRPKDRLAFPDSKEDRVGAYLHTGGTTGMPKIVQHKYSGMLYNGWCPKEVLFSERDVFLCPLPLFHAFAAYPILMGAIASGGHMVIPTPSGYRAEGIIENFWRLVERWKATFMVTVPTAVSALMQLKTDAEISSLRTALCAAAPLPKALFEEFERRTKVTILELYGLTEATGLVSWNPYKGERKIGSVGMPVLYTDVKAFSIEGDGETECGVDETGEICVHNPGVFVGNTYTDPSKNEGLYAQGKYLRTGDLGRIDADGYIWITGRAKDIILRGGRNIDPAVIEEAVAKHEDVAFVRAIGQPDRHAGEVPCAYVELAEGASATEADLLAYAREVVTEGGAAPVYVGIVDELPKSGVGKVLKPELRKMAIKRVFDEALRESGVSAEVAIVKEDKKLGLVAHVSKGGGASEQDVDACLSGFVTRWTWHEG